MRYIKHIEPKVPTEQHFGVWTTMDTKNLTEFKCLLTVADSETGK